MPHKISLPARGRGFPLAVVCMAVSLLPAGSVQAGDESEKPPRVSRLVPAPLPAQPGGIILRLGEGVANPPGLLGRYRMALEKESRRRLDKDPGLFQIQENDEDGNPVRRARSEARRIFGGATGRVLGDFAEILIEDAVALRTAKGYVQGIRLDVMSGGNVRFQPGRDDRESRNMEEPMRTARGEHLAASFSLIAIGSPRLEMRANLPGNVRTRIEIPLTEPGLRATFSRRFTSHLRGTLSAGVEDSGADTWATVGLGVRF